MLDKVFTNNQVTVAGEVVSTFTFSHEVYGEHFFMVNIAVCRLSSSYDIIPVMVSERLVDVKSDYRGCIMQACGQFRSYNRHDEAKNRLVLSVFAREITFLEENEEEQCENFVIDQISKNALSQMLKSDYGISEIEIVDRIDDLYYVYRYLPAAE